MNDPVSYIESSFLAPLLGIKGLTDVSYNGESLYCSTNEHGRKKSDVIVGKEEVGAFLRQIANLTGKGFSYSTPILDVSFGRYRLNAVFSSLARHANVKTYSFSVRLASPTCRIDGDENFFGGRSKEILLGALADSESIVIGGRTSTGKTELEKWLIMQLPEACRVIVIDNVEELDMISNPRIDLTTWLVSEQNNGASFAGLVRNALRNNPDYIVVAEARGAEMLDALVSAMSGRPILTTIHALDIESMPERMSRLAMLGNERLFKADLLDDIHHHFRWYAYLEKTVDQAGHVHRYLESLGRFDEGKDRMEIVYRRGRAC